MPLLSISCSANLYLLDHSFAHFPLYWIRLYFILVTDLKICPFLHPSTWDYSNPMTPPDGVKELVDWQKPPVITEEWYRDRKWDSESSQMSARVIIIILIIMIFGCRGACAEVFNLPTFCGTQIVLRLYTFSSNINTCRVILSPPPLSRVISR